jgi:chemotaxis regulatin CheY-phosphate phosphatase CheZ
VPLAAGPFGLDEVVAHLIACLEALGPGAHALAVSQAAVPALAAAALAPAPSAVESPLEDAAHHLRALLNQPESRPVGLAALPFILERATVEIQNVLANLRDSREALETATVEKIQHTSEKLKEVTSATEVAATDILDALDRAQTLVDDLVAADDAGNRDRARSTRDLLREEIYAIMNSLQFQDITNQQLAYASSVLTDMEGRLLAIARLFDSAAAPNDASTYDPGATARFAAERQALALMEHPGIAQVLDAGATDAVVSMAFNVGLPEPGPHRVLRASIVAAEALPDEQVGVIRLAGAEMPVSRFAAQPPTRESSGTIDAMPFYAGQSAGAVRAIQPAADIVAELAAGLPGRG